MAGREKKVVELEEGWEFMRRGIQKVIHLLERTSDDQFKVEEYSHLYTKIYDMCTQKPPHDYSDALYERYKQSFADYISAKVLPVLREKHGEYLLKEIVHRFANHKVMVRWLSRFFNYLDRYFISRRSLPSLSNAGLVCFKELVYEQLKDSVKDAVIVLINKEREGEQIDRALVKNVLDIFVEVDMGEMICYEEDFEKDMLEDTSAYYQRKASTWIHEDSCPLYMIKAEECLKKEKDRAEQYLHASSEVKLLKKAEEQLLSKKESDLIEKEHSGCHVLLRDDKTEDLMRMYRLFLRVQGLEPIAFMFRSHVTSEGNVLVGQAEEAASNRKTDKLAGSGAATYETIFVRRVIELHDKYMDYVSNCFGSHTLFHKALKEAFEVFCNKNVAGSSTAELLALYCDDLLKKGGSQKLSDEAIEEILDKVVKILAYVSDKDLFGEFYRKKLARRLLFDRSANDDHERSILTKLKQQYGGQFTSKMEGMVTDLTLAKENQKHYTEFLADKRGPGIEFSATVLTTGFWPTYKTSELALPEEMVKCVESFKNFYNARTASRKLTWIYSLGNCNVVAKFDAKPIELIVTTYQAAALVLFNGADRLSYTDIMTQLNLTDDDVIRLLHSLSCAKYKILLKRPYTESIIKETDIFEFNRKFTDKMRRIKIPLPPTDVKKKIIEDVDKDRRYAIDASLVRIMKSRKALTHQQLVLECVDQLSKMFKPDFKVIKKRIEELIQREYLERDRDNPNMYRYLA